MKQNADKARALSEVELEKQLKDGAEQMFRLRFQLSMGQADGLKKLRQLRKERARILTIQRENELKRLGTAPAAPAKTAKVTARPVAKKAKAAKPAAETAGAIKAPAVKKAAAKKAAAPKAALATTKTTKSTKTTAKE